MYRLDIASCALASKNNTLYLDSFSLNLDEVGNNHIRRNLDTMTR